MTGKTQTNGNGKLSRRRRKTLPISSLSEITSDENYKDDELDDDDDVVAVATTMNSDSSAVSSSFTMTSNTTTLPRLDTSLTTNNKLIKKPFSWRNFIVRGVTGVTLISCFYGLLLMGHFYCILFIVLVQTELYRELVNVRYAVAQPLKIKWFRSIQWGWFLVPMFFVYGEQLHKFCSEHRQLQNLLPVTQHLTKVAFVLYCILFVSSVLTLRQGLIKYQLSHYMWSVVTVCLVVFQCKFFGENILNGLFWFLFPASTVIFNDISAYYFGVTFGRKFIDTPLTPMSPNKSWEGFLGAAMMTIIFSFYFSAYLSNYQWIICPAESLYLVLPPPALTCDPHSVFLETDMDIPFFGSMRLRPIQIHGLAYGLFASLLAPFGGFYASAIKRAYKIKDFDSLFPGHGGVMDRVDCQLFMVAFTTVHYFSLIAPSQTPSIDLMMSMFARMNPNDQQALARELAKQIGLMHDPHVIMA